MSSEENYGLCRLAISSRPPNFLNKLYHISWWAIVNNHSDIREVYDHIKSISGKHNSACTIFSMNLALCFDTYTQSCMMIHSIAGSCCQSQHWGGRILRTKGPEFPKSWEAFTKVRNTFLLIACTVATKSTKKRNDKLRQRPFASWLLRCVKWYVLVEATNKISNLRVVWENRAGPKDGGRPNLIIF